jgi:hypothetical protein
MVLVQSVLRQVIAMAFKLLGFAALRRSTIWCAALAACLTSVPVESDARPRKSERARKPVVEAAAAPVIAPTAARGSSVLASLPAPAVAAARARPVSAVPLVAVVSLNAQSVTVYSGTDVVARSPISSGMSGYATPTGVFSIIQKARYHESNIYDNAPMPFMQRLTWSGVAFHAGRLPGYPASHGCVRLPDAFAERLFGMLKMGTRVVVAPEVAVPAPMLHAALPKPIYTAVPMLAEAPVVGPSVMGPNMTLASTAPGAPSGLSDQMLSPPQWAEHEKRRAQAALAEHQIEARRLLDVANQSAAAGDEARDQRLRVEREIVNFRSLLERARGQLERATDDEARMQATASMAAFEDALSDAAGAVARLVELERTLIDRSFVDARAARSAEDAVERADAALKVASRGAEPITVFVSRADRRVQVRQGTHTILEGDVDIRDPQSPLGTHVLTAGPVIDRSEGLAWTGVSISDGAARGLSASAALSRITLDADIADAIGRRTWSGATMLISDQPASKETGKGTDFVILTR